LVNAAGIMATGTVAETSLTTWSSVLSVNLTGAFDLTRQLLPLLRVTGGAVVMVGSVAADRTPAGAAAYAVSKAALVALARSIAVEEGRGETPVRCNVVNPGWTRSAMADGEMREALEHLGVADVEAAYAAVTRLVPLGRPATADEAANAITWLLSEAASYVNGATISVDGGHRLIDVGTVPFDYDVVAR
jgi:NAD(P)-dependent dehydrogenase (short-subunit alcohol dehydrogenase family)